MRTFVNDGLTFDVIDDGPPAGDVVILLHGFPQSSTAWSEVAPHLTDAGFRVLAPDQRGYSPEARPRERRAYRMSLLTGDVLALADTAGADRFHLVGHDWGAAVAWDLAARNADRVISLTALSVPHPRAFLASMRRSTQLLHSWYMFVFQAPGIERLVVRRDGALLRRVLASSGMPEPHAEHAFDRLMEPGALSAALSWYRAVPLDRQPLPGPITVPTTYVWSTGDVALVRSGADLTGQHVSGPYTFEVLDGVSHWIPEEMPVRTAELILARTATK